MYLDSEYSVKLHIFLSQFADQQLMRGFMETSAKTSKNVHEAVTQLAQAVLEINNPKLVSARLLIGLRYFKQLIEI